MNYEEKTNTATNRNDVKKSASTTKGISNEDNEKNTRTEIVKPKVFNLSSKTLSGKSVSE